jgi:hypothetical protein
MGLLGMRGCRLPNHPIPKSMTFNNFNLYAMDIRELMKNPFFVFVAGLLAIWVIFTLLKTFLSLSWLFVLGFIVLFIINERFRDTVQAFFKGLFNR